MDCVKKRILYRLPRLKKGNSHRQRNSCFLLVILFSMQLLAADTISVEMLRPIAPSKSSYAQNPYRLRRLWVMPGSLLIIPSIYLLYTSIESYNELKRDKNAGTIGEVFSIVPLLGMMLGGIATAGSSFCIVYGSINWHLYNHYEKSRSIQLGLTFYF